MAQSIPELSRRLHAEINELEGHVRESGQRIEDHQVRGLSVLVIAALPCHAMPTPSAVDD